MKFYNIILLIGFTSAIQLKKDANSYPYFIQNDPNILKVWGLRSVQKHEENINDVKGYAGFSTK